MPSLKQRLAAWIGGEAAFDSFDEAALELFAFQFGANPPYRRYCEARGIHPGAITEWREIPALPTDAFKFPAHRPRSFAAEKVTRRFLTSGTTRDIRGCHEFEDLELYERSITAGWDVLGLPAIRNPWFLSQTAENAPESSLTHMFKVLGQGRGRWMIGRDGTIDPEGLAASGPVQLFSTALALLRFSESESPVMLPEGSWIFETGGYKGLSETIDPAGFLGVVRETFGIDESRILNEYSMTELSSQFYRWTGEPCHRGPFWTRVRVVDPESGREAGEGEAGYLEIFDLANHGSVLAIRTQDLAIARGDSAFTLLGRDPGALPRGCSRAADELLTR